MEGEINGFKIREFCSTTSVDVVMKGVSESPLYGTTTKLPTIYMFSSVIGSYGFVQSPMIIGFPLTLPLSYLNKL